MPFIALLSDKKRICVVDENFFSRIPLLFSMSTEGGVHVVEHRRRVVGGLHVGDKKFASAHAVEEILLVIVAADRQFYLNLGRSTTTRMRTSAGSPRSPLVFNETL